MHYSFGLAALFAGIARAALALNIFAIPNHWLPGLYTAIDIGLLLGLVGAYLQAQGLRHNKLYHWGFVVSLGGIAFIAGPEASFYGHSAYQLGTTVIGIGLLLWALPQLRGQGQTAAAYLLLASVACGIAAMFLNIDSELNSASGLLFGLGFVLIGVQLLRR